MMCTEADLRKAMAQRDVENAKTYWRQVVERFEDAGKVVNLDDVDTTILDESLRAAFPGLIIGFGEWDFNNRGNKIVSGENNATAHMNGRPCPILLITYRGKGRYYIMSDLGNILRAV